MNWERMIPVIPVSQVAGSAPRRTCERRPHPHEGSLRRDQEARTGRQMLGPVENGIEAAEVRDLAGLRERPAHGRASLAPAAAAPSLGPSFPSVDARRPNRRHRFFGWPSTGFDAEDHRQEGCEGQLLEGLRPRQLDQRPQGALDARRGRRQVRARGLGRGFRPTDDPEFRKINPVAWCPSSTTATSGCARATPSCATWPRSTAAPTSIRGPRAARHDRSWMDWASTDFGNGMRPVFHGLVVKNPAVRRQGRERRQGMGRQMSVLEATPDRQGSLCHGRDFTIGDIPVGSGRQPLVLDPLQETRVQGRLGLLRPAGRTPPYKAHGRNGTP